jgi:hypothetical protein
MINGADLDYIVSALPKLLSANGELNLVKTVPNEFVKELLLKGALDKDLNLTNEEGKKTSLKEALLTLKTSEETNAQPSYTPKITPTEPEKIEPGNELVKSLGEIFEKFKEQVIEANKTNSCRISANEVAMLRKHFEDENFKLYLTKIIMTGVTAKNGWDLAQAAKKVIMNKITETNREEADKLVSECKLETCQSHGL